MGTKPRPTCSRASDVEIDVDGLVASYTALGRRERRKARLRRAIRVCLGLTAVAGAALAAAYDVPHTMLQALIPSDSSLLELRALVSSELEQLDAVRAELESERDRYNANRQALERELAAFTERQAALERQQASLVAQGVELRDALAAIDAERDALLANVEAPNPAIDRELAAIAEQRRELEEQWESFASQGQQITNELALLEERRDELDDERAAMDRQRRELEALIQDALRASETTSGLAEPTIDMGLAEPTIDTGLDPLFANAVMAPELGEMRGGVQLPNGMNIAIGLTRSASLNGVEQYSSSLRLDDLSAGIGAAGLDGFGTTLLQNGTGNFVAPSVLDGLSSGFGTIIQNSMDNQEIRTLTTLDVEISDVSNAIRNIATGQAITDSLTLRP